MQNRQSTKVRKKIDPTWAQAWLGYAGLMLQMGAFIFISSTLYDNGQRIAALQLNRSHVVAAVLIAVLASLAGILFQVCALRELLGSIAQSFFYFRDVFVFHGRTAIAKYLPGNIFHFVGRQLLARQLGWNGSAVLSASLIEATVLVAASCTVALFGLSFQPELLPFGFPRLAIASCLAVGILLPLALIAVASFFPVGTSFFPKFVQLRHVPILSWLSAYLLNLFFLLTGVAVLTTSLALFSDGFQLQLLAPAAFGFGLSYVAGFLTPGAPGGFGVREALLILCLAPDVGAGAASAAAILARVGSITAECLCWLATRLSPNFAQN